MQAAASNQNAAPVMAFAGMNRASNAGGVNAQNLFARGSRHSRRCSHSLSRAVDGHVHAELLIQVSSAQSADSRVRQDRGPAAVELLIRVNSVRNVDDQDHNLRR